MKKSAILMACAMNLLFSTPAPAWFPADQGTVESLDALVVQYEQNAPETADWQAWQGTYITDLEKLVGTARADMLCIMKDTHTDAIRADLTAAEAELAKLETVLMASVKKQRPDAALAQGELKISSLKLKLRLYIATMNGLPAHPGCYQ